MFSIPSLYELGTCPSDSYDHMLSMSSPENLSPRSLAEAKAVAATNSHREAERRRRKRINGHIATLKSILPNTIKTDKASLLGEAVRRVKELRKAISELAGDELKSIAVPSEADELKLSRCEASGLIRATLSCDDRPDVIVDTIRAMRSAEAKVERAEMSTVGVRTKSVLWVRMEGESDVVLGRLRRALRTVVMDKSTLLAGSGQGLPGNKRPRYYHL